MQGFKQPETAFTGSQAQFAINRWDPNCGPFALAAALGIHIDEVENVFLKNGYAKKKYTNIKMMYSVLNELDVEWKGDSIGGLMDISELTGTGLVRIQWCGPWTDPAAHWMERQRHTHWIATKKDFAALWIFDVNAIATQDKIYNGWIRFEAWRDQLVPWLLKECEPGANGDWLITHYLTIKEGMNYVSETN